MTTRDTSSTGSVNSYAENMEFEREVRRVAEAIWGIEPGTCQPAHYAGHPVLHELDGIIHLRDITHIIMATVSRRLEKVEDDIKKLDAAEKIEKRSGIPLSKWLITKYQLDAQHVTYAKSHNVTAITLDNFRNRFVNGRDYITKRRTFAFGSARNLVDGTATLEKSQYIDLPMAITEYDSSGKRFNPGASGVVNIQELENRLLAGEMIVLVGPFGAGKSFTAHELFSQLSKKYLKETVSSFPVAISLRDHWEQVFSDEILERHSRRIGFIPKENLTIAWRAGIISLIIDGFDELATQSVTDTDRMDFMRQARYRALEGVRDIVTNTPSGVGLLLCGRDHYFDSVGELKSAAGIGERSFSIVKLGEFTEKQAAKFLKANGITTPLPDWLPRKPLILGYLVTHGLLDEVIQVEGSQGFGHAWKEFLRLICDREALHGRGTMNANAIHNILLRLACDVRATVSGTGPITSPSLAEAYQQETGIMPVESDLMQLQRLPGLTERDQGPGTRSFIDEDMLAALQGEAMAHAILGELKILGSKSWLECMSDKAISMAAYLLKEQGTDTATVISAANRFANESSRIGIERQASADCLMIALEMAYEDGSLNCRDLLISDASISRINVEEIKIDRLSLHDCVINEVILGPTGIASSIIFRNCAIARLSGAANIEGLPKGMFINPDIYSFDDMSTNTAVIKSALSSPMKALVTVLRKLYLQAGAGRKIGSLRRGFADKEVSGAVEKVVKILESEHLVYIINDVIHPVRRQMTRINNILNAPNISNDDIVVKVKSL